MVLPWLGVGLVVGLLEARVLEEICVDVGPGMTFVTYHASASRALMPKRDRQYRLRGPNA